MNNNWPVKSLGDLLQKTETINPLDFPNDEFEYVDVSSVSNETFCIESTQRLRGKDAPSRARRRIRTNDVLFATIRPTLKRIAVVPEVLDNQVCSTGYAVLRARPGLNHRFLFYSLFTRSFLERIAALQKGTSYPAVTESDLRAQKIPFPPLAEQERIVKILDTASEHISFAHSNVERMLASVRALSTSYIANEFRESSDEWEVSTVERLATNLDSRRVPITKNLRTAGKYPYYGASGIVDYVNDFIFEGDALLVSEDGANLLTRSSPIAFSVAGKYWVNNHAHILQFKNLATQRYVEFYLDSIKLDEFVTGAAQPKLTQSALNSIPVPIPRSVQEQTRIVERIETFIKRAYELKSVYERKRSVLDELKQSFLHHAFSGAL